MDRHFETTAVVISPNTQVGNFRATDNSATLSYQQYADAAASAGLITAQFNNPSPATDWPSMIQGNTMMQRDNGIVSQQTRPNNTFTLEVVPAPAGNCGNNASLQHRDEQIIKRLPRIPGGYPCHHSGCSSRWDTKKAVNKHVRTHILGINRKHKCTRCGKGFNDRRDLNRHLGGKNPCRPRSYSTQHLDPIDSIATSRDDSSSMSVEPSRDVTQDEVGSPNSTQSSSASSNISDTQTMFRCHTCGENFADKLTLLDHNRHSNAHNPITIDET